MASEIWSAILSGWPSVTDSEVNRYLFFDKAASPCKQSQRFLEGLGKTQGGYRDFLSKKAFKSYLRSHSTATGLLAGRISHWLRKISDLLRILRVRCGLGWLGFGDWSRGGIGFSTFWTKRDRFHFSGRPQGRQ